MIPARPRSVQLGGKDRCPAERPNRLKIMVLDAGGGSNVVGPNAEQKAKRVSVHVDWRPVNALDNTSLLRQPLDAQASPVFNLPEPGFCRRRER